MNTVRSSLQLLSVNSRGAMMALASAINKAGAEDVLKQDNPIRDLPERYRSWEEIVREKRNALAKKLFGVGFDELSVENKEVVDSKLDFEKGIPEEKPVSLIDAVASAEREVTVQEAPVTSRLGIDLSDISVEEKEDDGFGLGY